MKDLTPDIIQYLQSNPELLSLIQDRFVSPFFAERGDRNEPNPKLALRQAGGGAEFHKYIFTVRGDDIKSARTVATKVVSLLIDNAISLPDVSLKWVELDGSLNDSVNEISNEPEVFFYVNFYFFEA